MRDTRSAAHARYQQHAAAFRGVHLWPIAGVLFCLLLMSARIARSGDQPIAEVTVQGNKGTDAQLIKNVSGLTPGQTLTPDILQQAIHQVYGLKLFDDVRILGEPFGGGLRVIIKVVESPRLGKLVFKGNKEIKEADFKLDLKNSQTLSPGRLRDAERLIRRAYREKGFFLVEVGSRVVPTSVIGEADAVFDIKENKPVGVEAVVFEGNTQLSADALMKKMKNKPRGLLKSIFGGGKFNREKYNDDKTAILDTYKKNGFLDAILVSDTIILDEAKTKVTLRLVVSEGTRYFFGKTTFTGQQIFSEDKLRRALKYHPGDVYDQEKFEESIANIYTAYQEDGYLYARVTDETKTADSTVNMTYEISEGVPAHVHLINVEGNVKTKDKVIRRELAIYPGEVFRRSNLMRSLRNVMQLNFFSNVTPDYKVLPDGQVDLAIKVEEKPTGQVQVGAGYSGQDKLVGTVSLGIPNFLGNGQDANLSVDFGKRRQSYSLGFTEPWFLDTPTSLGLDLHNTARTWDEPQTPGTNDYAELRRGFSLRLGRRLRWPDDYFRVYWDYRFESVNYKDFSGEYGTYNLSNPFSYDKFTWPQTTSSTSLTISRDSRDLPEFATRGSRSSYSVEFAGGVFGGQWTYRKHIVTHAQYWPVWKGLTLAPVWKVGLIEGGAGLTSVPQAESFYAGGIRSDGMIRGYDDGAILASAFLDTSSAARMQAHAPLTSLLPGAAASGYMPSRLVRGRALAVMNAEMTFPIVQQQIHGILFFDAGNVWLNASQMAPFSNMYSAYGFGFRIAVPGMGTLGFDFGIPLRGIPALGIKKGKIKPHFQFGGSF